jgi:hypothetical protein
MGFFAFVTIACGTIFIVFSKRFAGKLGEFQRNTTGREQSLKLLRVMYIVGGTGFVVIGALALAGVIRVGD